MDASSNLVVAVSGSGGSLEHTVSPGVGSGVGGLLGLGAGMRGGALSANTSAVRKDRVEVKLQISEGQSRDGQLTEVEFVFNVLKDSYEVRRES